MTKEPGTYTLVLRAVASQTIQIGRLGVLQVQPGYYVYVGSAFGPGGLGARLGHHLKPVRRLHWHIDYLRQAAEIQEVWYTADSTPREHEWAMLFRQMPGVCVPMQGFGASDCTCVAHLFYFGDKPPKPSFVKKQETEFLGKNSVSSCDL